VLTLVISRHRGRSELTWRSTSASSALMVVSRQIDAVPCLQVRDPPDGAQIIVEGRSFLPGASARTPLAVFEQRAPRAQYPHHHVEVYELAPGFSSPSRVPPGLPMEAQARRKFSHACRSSSVTCSGVTTASTTYKSPR
jgi:hypothetical protein